MVQGMRLAKIGLLLCWLADNNGLHIINVTQCSGGSEIWVNETGTGMKR
jgi:hypothetical protein